MTDPASSHEEQRRESGQVQSYSQLAMPDVRHDQFEFDDGVDETIQMVKCASCRREMMKDDLLRENSENISEHVKEIGDEVTKEFAKKMRDTLRQAFRGSKYIKVR